MELRYRQRPENALSKISAALVRQPLAGIEPADRPYPGLARVYAAAGRVGEAQRLLAEFERVVPEGLRRGNTGRLWAAAEIAKTQGNYPEAIAQYAAGRTESGCPVCGLFEVAGIYEKMGQTDSALAAYEQLVAQPVPYRWGTDAYALAPTYQRLGELYEARGDRAKARDYYGRFVDLWKNADPELQPAVRDVRQRIARLTGEL